MTYHYPTYTDSGATCSCGREFSVWAVKKTGYWAASDTVKFNRIRNMCWGNAQRHADAANKKESA